MSFVIFSLSSATHPAIQDSIRKTISGHLCQKRECHSTGERTETDFGAQEKPSKEKQGLKMQ